MAIEHVERDESADSSPRLVWSVNLLCIVGASIGVVAVFLGWIYIPPSIPTVGYWGYPTIPYMVVIHCGYYGAATLFLLGVMIAFVSPIGGVLQSGSLVLFMTGIIESGDDPVLDGIDPQQKVWFGMAFGAVSCVVVLTSLFFPLGTGRLRFARSRGIRLGERLLTVTLSITHD
jgi:hypothetical protein